MTYVIPSRGQTQRVITSTSGTCSLTDPLAGTKGGAEVIVIDWIIASGTTSSSLDLVVAVAGNNVARKTLATTSDFIWLQFTNGFPVWSASDTDTGAATTVTVTLTGPTSNSQLVVGYHFAIVSTIRD
jgi:hypothetical protein